MYRGSAADFLVVLCQPGNPTTNATEGDYTHLDNFLWFSSEGAPAGVGEVR